MPKPNTTLGKNLHLCFSLIKRPQPHPSSPSPPQILHNYHHCPPPTTPTTTLIKNYNSLYEDSSYYSAPASPSDDTDMAGDEAEAAVLAPATPDLTAIYASQRFFISSPGRSNSIVDSLSLSPSSSSSATSSTEVAGGVPVQTYSPNPYVDFRRSMEEMVEARDDELEGKEGWDYLQELLVSYLSLNPKNTHKYIVGAFADLVASLLLSPNHFINNNNS